ncbi:MAG: phosphoglucomutase/phosphomannomutase family protein [Synergistetes bacterium]|nr:phosphoglucomutase/phosphomannomutase family protein [Synergistota bacterium]MCX8127975.1 phosphoglucomutase/phosphomannomutase family protein [Synergistota bacterium]MDW8192830.1 phosphoglucomutase/phosphomannomutase family protein [Synergistota bacterium]
MSTEIKFGTDGWRGIIALDFTFENVKRVARGIVAYLLSEERPKLKMYSWGVPLRGADKGIVVGYDRRFLSDEFAMAFSEEVAKYGIPVFLSKEPVPTPAVSYGVLLKNASLGVMITASHNPPKYNGIKLKPEYGGPALPEVTSLIEKMLDARLTQVSKPAPVFLVDLKNEYIEGLKRGVSLFSLSGLPFKVVVDVMYGSGEGVLSRVLDSINIEVEEIHAETNPYFGGLHPEPIPPNTDGLSRAILQLRGDVGIVLDGDADRIGLVDEEGNFVNPHQVFALLMKHLIENRGKRGKVVWTCSLGREPEKLAEKYGIEYSITPVGFKHICEHILQGGVLLGGEESGGFGFVEHLPERDGSMSALLILEMMSKKKKAIKELIKELYIDFGPYYYKRLDLKLDKKVSFGQLKELGAILYSLVNEYPVRVEDIDGLKLHFSDESWLLIRPSGTEPLLRLYCQAPSLERLDFLLEKAKEATLNV